MTDTDIFLPKCVKPVFCSFVSFVIDWFVAFNKLARKEGTLNQRTQWVTFIS